MQCCAGQTAHPSSFCLKHVGLWFLVCVQASVCSPRSNSFGLWFLVCVQASVCSPCSNTFEWRFLVRVQATVSSPVFQTRLNCGSLSVYTHPSTALCFKHVLLWSLVCLQASVLSQNGYGTGQTETPLREEWEFVFLQILLCVDVLRGTYNMQCLRCFLLQMAVSV